MPASAQSIFTEGYLYGEEIMKEVTLAARYIWQHVRGKLDCEDYDVVINVKVDRHTNKIIWRWVNLICRRLGADVYRQ